MPTYKLTYYDSQGYAEISRLLFALQGQKFEDVRFTPEDWPKFKPDSPFGQAPFLEVDGVKIAQSMAISNYLAREFGLYGKTNAEMTQVDTVLGFRTDVFQALIKWYYEKDETKKAECENEMYETKLPVIIGAFEKMLAGSKSGFFVGDKIGYADIAAFDALDGKFNEEKLNAVLKNFKNVVEHRKRVEANANIKAYLANRKVTKN